MQNERSVARTIQNDQFFHLLDAIPSAIAYIDSTFQYQYANQAYQALLKKTSEELVGQKVYDIIGAEKFLLIKQYLDRVFSGHAVQFEHQQHDGNALRMFDVTYTPDLRGKKVKGYTVHINDVTRQRISEREFRDYIENATIGLHWVDENGTILWANQAEMEMLGYSKDEYIGRHISEFHTDPEIITDILVRLARNETLQHYEATLRAKDGSLRYVLINSNVLWENGKFIHTRCFTMDITAKKLAEQKLSDSFAEYQRLLEALPIAVYTCDKEGRVKFYNQAAVDLWGRKPEVGKDLWCGSSKIFRKDLSPVELVDCLMAIAVKEGREVYGEEMIIERTDGTRRFIKPFPKPVYNEKGELVGGVNAIVDITPQKEAEAAFDESKGLYKQLVNNLPVPIYTCDANGYILAYNHAAVELWGREPVIGKDLWCGSWKIFNPDGTQLPLDSCPMALALKGKKPVLGMEIIVERPDGQRRNVVPHPYPLFDQKGEIIGAVNLLLDITEQKKSIQALMESEERFKTVASQTPVIVWLMNEQGGMIYFNEKWSDVTGQKIETALGHGWVEFIHPQEKEKTLDLLNQLAKSARSFETKFRYLGKKNNYLTMKFSGTPRKDSHGNFIGHIGTMLDITFQENIQASLEKEITLRTSDLLRKNIELKKSEERYHRMVSEVQDYAIILLNREGIIQNWNNGAEKIKGYSASEAVGKSFKMFYTTADRERKLPDSLLETAERNGRATHEGWRVRKDGTLFWGSVVLTAVHDENNDVVGFSKVTRDLTEKKAAEDTLKMNALKLEEKNKELERMNHELSSFAYVSSHDLQEPLRKIQTFSSRIQETELDKLSERGKDYFERIQRAAHRMRILIEDLLTYSRANVSEKKFVDTDLNTVLTDAKEDLKELIAAKDATIIADELPTIAIIPFQFQQLLINILSNALKFSKPSVPPEIKISYKLTEVAEQPYPVKYHCLRISDNGIGFEPAFNLKVFEIFQRLHNRNEYEGTGVGLAICKKIVENHGGFMTAKGVPGEGATFEIYLPA